MKDGLRVRVPFGDADQPDTGAAGQRGVAFEQASQVVRVRIDGQHVGVERKTEVVGDDEVAVTGGNVERAVMLELYQHREPVRWLVGEVQADRGLRPLGLSGGLEMRVEHQFIARIETPRQAVRLLPGRAAGLPEQEVAVEIEGGALDRQIHSGEAGAWFLLQAARRAGTVDDQVGVMHREFIAFAALHGADLDCPDVVCGLELRRQDEVPENVGAGSGHGERAGGFEDHVGRSQLPAIGEMRGRWLLSGRAFRRALGDPFGDAGDLRVTEPPLVHKIAVAGSGQPGRHLAAAGDNRNFADVFLHLYA